MNILFALVTAGILFFIFVLGGLSLAPWVPTRKRDVTRIHRMANLKKGEIFLELGCGDGRVAREIAIKNPEAICIGLEISPLLLAIAHFRNRLFPLPNLSFRRGNIFQEDLSKADVLYVFGRRESMKNIEKQVWNAKNKKGQRLLSYHFPLPKTPFTRKDGGEDQQEATIYEYVR